jgi:AcrR family transcriptional regulator
MVQVPAPITSRGRPKVRERNRRRILDAARDLVAVGGMEALSMRTLAARAGVSATTLYNLFGEKDEVVRVLAHDILRDIDAAFVDVVADDPIEQLRARILMLVDHVIEHAPPSLVSAVLEDAVLTEQINAQWESRTVVESALAEAVARGLLRDDLHPRVLAEHVRAGLLHQQRLWAAAVIDDEQYRAAAGYGVDLALLAVAHGARRDSLLANLRTYEPVLRRS